MRAKAVCDALAAYRDCASRVIQLLGLREELWPADGDDHFERANERLRAWSSQMGAYRAWCLYARSASELRVVGLGALADAHRSGALHAVDCEAAAERALLGAWVAAARDRAPVLRDFDGRQHHRVVDRFRKADADHIDLARKHIIVTLESKLPRAAEAAATSASSSGR